MLNSMSTIPNFPLFSPLCMDMEKELHPLLKNSCEGISEFSFPSLLIHQEKYKYEISRYKDKHFILKGIKDNQAFFSILGTIPTEQEITDIFQHLGNSFYWKNMSKNQYDTLVQFLENQGYILEEDRDNDDYLYDKQSLAELKGKVLHKKKTHVNNFDKNYTFSIKTLNNTTISHAEQILQLWEKEQPENSITDYETCLKAFKLIDKDYFCGFILYVDDSPCAFALGEIINNNSTFCVHFEKALTHYKGIYQKINQITASNLDDSILYINREQDLGLEGLRKAKLSYKPLCLIQKFTVNLPKQIETNQKSMIGY